MTKETIYETYTRQICNNCKNKEQCQEELRIKIDRSIKCDNYEDGRKQTWQENGQKQPQKST